MFYKPETENTESNPHQKKTEPNRKKSSQTGFFLENRTKTGWFEPVSVRFKKNRFCYFFFIKTEPNKK